MAMNFSNTMNLYTFFRNEFVYTSVMYVLVRNGSSRTICLAAKTLESRRTKVTTELAGPFDNEYN